MAIDYTSDRGKVRLLINDVDEAHQVFTDIELDAFVLLEDSNIKRAAAQAIDTIADDEALTAKAFRDRDLTVDGPKVADSLRKRADALRAQADRDEQRAAEAAEDTDDGFYFGLADVVGTEQRPPELTEWPLDWAGGY